MPREEFTDGGGGLFGWLGEILISAFRGLGVFLAPLFVLLDDSLKSVGIDLGSAIDAVFGVVGSIFGAIDGIVDWIQGIFDDFVAGAREFLEALVAGAILLVQSFVDFFAAFIFLIWDEFGLPDILAIATVGLDGIVTILLGAPAFILSVINDWILPLFIIILCLYWLWLVFLSFAEEGFDPLAGFSNFIDRLFVMYNFDFAGFGPIPIPIALFFIPMTYFMIIVPSGSIFSIW